MLSATELNGMTNPLDPALFHPDAVAPETRNLNATMVQVLTPTSDWWVIGEKPSPAEIRDVEISCRDLSSAKPSKARRWRNCAALATPPSAPTSSNYA